MNIIIRAANIELTDPLRAYVYKRLASSERLIADQETALHVEIGRSSNRHRSGDVFRAEIRTSHGGRRAYARVVRDDLYAAIDEVTDRFTEELAGRAGRAKRLWKRGAQRFKDMIKGLPIVRKRFRK